MLPNRELFVCKEPRLSKKVLISLVVAPSFRKVLMKEKTTPRKAVEMAASIGSQPKEIENNWKSLGMRNLSLKEQLETMGSEMQIEDREWQKLLSQAGSWLIDLLDQKIENIQTKVVEQETAIELRRLFGVPLSLLAMPVFVELEKMELLAKMDLKNEAIDIAQIWEQINNRVLYMIQIFLAGQIEAVENEEKAHQEALKSSQNEAKGMEALSGTVHQVEDKFSLKLKALKERKKLLLQNFKKVGGNMQNYIGNSFETTIFSASRQSVQPVAVA